MFQYFFSGSFISLQMTFTARAAPSCIAWSEAFQRHSRPPLTPFLSFKTALAPTTRCTRKRTEKVHPPENPKIGTDPFFPFTLLPESLNHTGHRSWFESYNQLKYFAVFLFITLNASKASKLFRASIYSVFCAFFRNSNEEDSLSCSFNRSEGDKKTFEKVCYSGKNHLGRQRIQPFASATIIVLNSLS